MPSAGVDTTDNDARDAGAGQRRPRKRWWYRCGQSRRRQWMRAEGGVVCGIVSVCATREQNNSAAGWCNRAGALVQCRWCSAWATAQWCWCIGVGAVLLRAHGCHTGVRRRAGAGGGVGVLSADRRECACGWKCCGCCACWGKGEVLTCLHQSSMLPGGARALRLLVRGIVRAEGAGRGWQLQADGG
jgi:hypothetical protein